MGGLEAGTVLTTLATHATPGSEVVTRQHSPHHAPGDTVGGTTGGTCGTHRRLLTLGGAPTAVTLVVHRGGVIVRAPAPALDEAADIVRWWFDLPTDPGPVAARLSLDPRLAPLVRQRPALRPLRHPAGFEATVDTVLGQQVTLASARLFGARLRSAYSPGAVEGLRVFPSPETLSRTPSEDLRAAVGLTTSRARTVQAIAALFADGFTLGRGSDPGPARETLLAVPGIGPWTVEYLALRVLGDPDAFPASDAVVRRALRGAPAREVERLSRPWRPHRAWATAHLWAGQSTG